MAFWGIEVKSGRPYIHMVDNTQGRLHISQATLGFGTTDSKKIQVQCNVGNKTPVLLCSLLPDKVESCFLNLEYEEIDAVVFSVIGSVSVHLTGYYLNHTNLKEDDDTDSCGEDIGHSDSDKEEEEDDDYDDNDSFIDDGDLEVYPSSPLSNGGVDSEDYSPKKVSKKLKKKKGLKRLRKKCQLNESDNDNDNNAEQKKVVSRRNRAIIMESDDEDILLPISSFITKTKNVSKNVKIESEKNRDKEINAEAETSKENEKIEKPNPSKNVDSEEEERQKKAGKKRKKKEIQSSKVDLVLKEVNKEQLEAQDSVVKNDVGSNSINPSVALVDEKQPAVEKIKKTKSKKQKQSSDLEVKVDTGSVKSISNVKMMTSGLLIEELEMGEPNAKLALEGKKISIWYTGKLKETGTVVDTNIGGALLKFRIGSPNIIEGLNVGVDGMRVGEKRRITIPPSMGYGTDENDINVPPNAWLIYDVELIKTH